ncbi:Type I restriction-modification system, specificity subunit S [Labilithrix luteola]|uniref:Type I restriction-modification system, specificity subunit S n=1 Tax=Labilithrix luteola TaxID=1391654 RepID=A0A0K1QFB8_9BACT|nr:Type I restriction-modification system, specificity subunit S [Labilithrix luteola]
MDDLAALVQYGSSSKTSEDEAGIPVLRMGNIVDGRLVFEGLKYLPHKHEEFPELLLKPGDVLFNRTNSPELVGKTAVFTAEHPSPCSFASYLIRLRFREYEPNLFAAYLNSTHGRAWIRSCVTQQVGQANVSGGKLKELEIPVPPLNEQRRIVAKLETLRARSSRAREALDAVPALLEKLRQSILAAAFRGDLTRHWRAKNKDVEPASKLLERIRIERRKKWEESELAKLKAKGKAPTDDRWKSKYTDPERVDTTRLPDLPEGWCWAAWQEVGFSQNGRAFPSSEYAEDGEKLLRPGNLHVSGKLEWTQANTRRMPRRWAEEYPDFVVGGNELVMNLTAQSLKDEFLGRVCLSGPEERCLLNQRIARLTPIGLPPRYWLWFFKSPMFRRHVDTLNTGSLIQHMFTSQLDEFAVPIMPLAEANLLIELLSERLEGARATMMLVKEQSARFPEIDRAILAKAFRGELVPQDSNDGAARIPNAGPDPDPGSSELPNSGKRTRNTRRKAS